MSNKSTFWWNESKALAAEVMENAKSHLKHQRPGYIVRFIHTLSLAPKKTETAFAIVKADGSIQLFETERQAKAMRVLRRLPAPPTVQTWKTGQSMMDPQNVVRVRNF